MDVDVDKEKTAGDSAPELFTEKHNNNNSVMFPTGEALFPTSDAEAAAAPEAVRQEANPLLIKSEPQSIVRRTTVLFKPYLDLGTTSGGGGQQGGGGSPPAEAAGRPPGDDGPCSSHLVTATSPALPAPLTHPPASLSLNDAFGYNVKLFCIEVITMRFYHNEHVRFFLANVLAHQKLNISISFPFTFEI